MPAYTELLQKRFGDRKFPESQFRDNKRIHVPAEDLFEIMKCLKDGGFDMLADVCGIDYLNYPNAKDRFGVVYSLTNTNTGERLFVKVGVNDPNPSLDSVYSLWKGADWLEREVYDMFGIKFLGHPDLRRILLPDEFVAHPLRKDYPLRGRGERHNFPSLTRAES